MIDERGELPAPVQVRVRTGRVARILGTEVSAGKMRGLLEPIGFACRAAGDDLDVTVPSFRPDTATEIDVIEEVARHLGYATIPPTVPQAAAGRLDSRQQLRRVLRQGLVGAGVSEAMPLPFLAPGDLERAGVPADAVVVSNPLDASESVLRTSLRPGLLKALAYNASHRNAEVSLFEMGRVFHRPTGDQVLPDEPEMLAVVLGGSDATAALDVWGALSAAMRVEAELVAGEQPGLHATRTATLVVGETVIGVVGEVDPLVATAFEVESRVGWLEVDLERLARVLPGPAQHRAISTYPSADIDLAFEVDETEPAGALQATIAAAGGDLVATVGLFDVYRGAGVGEGRRSLAFRLRLQAHDRTLTDAEIAEVRRQVIDAVHAAHPATLRG